MRNPAKMKARAKPAAEDAIRLGSNLLLACSLKYLISSGDRDMANKYRNKDVTRQTKCKKRAL
jgi:hypothetical protein